jgi:hypothetical protein
MNTPDPKATALRLLDLATRLLDDDAAAQAMTAAKAMTEHSEAQAREDALRYGVGISVNGKPLTLEDFFAPSEERCDCDVCCAFEGYEDEGERDLTQEEVIDKAVAEAMAEHESEMLAKFAREARAIYNEAYLAGMKSNSRLVNDAVEKAIARIIEG